MDLNALIVPIIGSVLTLVLGWLTAWLIKNGKPLIWTLVVNFADGLVKIAVGDVNQTFVDAKKLLSEDGEWSKQDQKDAFMLALKKFASLAGPLLIKLLQDIWGANYEANLQSMVEAQVREQKLLFPISDEPIEPI